MVLTLAGVTSSKEIKPCWFYFLAHFFDQNSSVPSDFPVLACCLKDCIEDVAEWMADSKLKMNDDKTELMAIGTRSKLSQVIPNLAPVSISGCDIQFSQSVRNLGFYLDETLSMDAHIKYLCSILFCQLRRIGKIRSFLSTDAANKLTVSLILSRLDYCNSLLAGLPDNKLNKLQRIQNHAARLVLRKSSMQVQQHCWEHSTGFQWRLGFSTKLLVSVFNVSIRTVCHLTFLTFFIHTVPLGCCALDTSLLTVPRFSLETFGKKSFSVFGPTVWNSLPLSLRKTQCFTTFKVKLKTHLFRTHLCWSASDSFCVYHSGGVCLCMCVCVCVCVCHH